MRNLLTTLGSVVVLVGAGVFWYVHHHKVNANQPTNPGTALHASNGINYGPPSSADKQASEANKNQPSGTGSNTTSGSSAASNSNKKQVEVDITTWSQQKTTLNVNGFVGGVVESGGACTLKLVNGSSTVTQSRQAVANATNTSCGVTEVPLSKLHPGTWQTTLGYSSKTSAGTSAIMDITVH